MVFGVVRSDVVELLDCVRGAESLSPSVHIVWENVKSGYAVHYPSFEDLSHNGLEVDGAPAFGDSICRFVELRDQNGRA